MLSPVFTSMECSTRTLASASILGSRMASHQILGVQGRQFRQHKPAVLADQHVVEVDLSPAVFRRLNQHQIPVDGTVVAIIGVFVTVAGGKVDAPRDLLIKEGVPIDWLMLGFTPMANSPTYRAPSSVSR